MKFTYSPKGVCSRKIVMNLEDGIITDVAFEGGCNGNLKGMASLVKGRSAKEVVELLSGIRCDSKSTSCPDQLSKACEAALAQMEQ